MMEEKMEGGNTCNCGCHKMHGMMGGRHIAKKIVMILVLIVVFWFGTKLGELRTLMEYSRGSHMMMDGGYGSRMMTTPATAMPGTPAAQ
jgi:hypothetical protein